MKGLWKNKISGFNSKGVKRKKQSFKHVLKDNKKYLFKNPNTVEIEYVNRFIYDKISNQTIKILKTPIFLLEVTFYNFYKELETKTLEVFYISSSKYGYDTIIVIDSFKKEYKELKSFLGLSNEYRSSYHPKIVSKKIIRELNKDIDITRDFQLDIEWKDEDILDKYRTIFFHGKKIENYIIDNMFSYDRYSESLTNKFYQKTSNRKRRTLEKRYIDNQNWEDDSYLPRKNRYGWWDC